MSTTELTGRELANRAWVQVLGHHDHDYRPADPPIHAGRIHIDFTCASCGQGVSAEEAERFANASREGQVLTWTGAGLVIEAMRAKGWHVYRLHEEPDPNDGMPPFWSCAFQRSEALGPRTCVAHGASAPESVSSAAIFALSATKGRETE